MNLSGIRFKIWGFILILSVALVGCTGSTIRRSPSHMDIIGEQAPDISRRTIRGDQLQLREYRDQKIVLINFFGTWCPPCRAELPQLFSLYRTNRENVQLVGVALNIKGEAVLRFQRNLNTKFPTVLSPKSTDSGIPEQYRIPTVPTTVVVGLDGDIIYYRPGMLREFHFRDLQNVIDQELSSRFPGHERKM